MSKHNFKVGEMVRVVRSGCGFAGWEVGRVVTISELGMDAYRGARGWAFKVEEKAAGNNSPLRYSGWHDIQSIEKIEPLKAGKNAEQLGFKVGDYFVVEEESKAFTRGSVVMLYRDDGSYCPLFKLIIGSSGYNHAHGKPGAYENFTSLIPISKETFEAVYKEQTDQKVEAPSAVIGVSAEAQLSEVKAAAKKVEKLKRALKKAQKKLDALLETE